MWGCHHRGGCESSCQWWSRWRTPWRMWAQLLTSTEVIQICWTTLVKDFYKWFLHFCKFFCTEPHFSLVDDPKNMTCLMHGRNWPLQWKMRYVTKTDLLWSKNVTWPKRGPNWPPLMQKRDVTKTGPQLTSFDPKSVAWPTRIRC